jgi:hypothetical protein
LRDLGGRVRQGMATSQPESFIPSGK